MASTFMPVYLLGAALLALWVDVRFPRLAPASLTRRTFVAGCAMAALVATPVLTGSPAALYASLFALLLPVLVSSLLAALWMLRALRDAQLGH